MAFSVITARNRSVPQFPIMLALDLSVEEMKEQLTRENKNKSNKKSENAEKEISPQMSAFLKGIDEADKGRLEVN